MPGRFLILFVVSIVLLIISEYMFLMEAYADKRGTILLFAGAGVIVSISLFFLIYRKFRKTIK